MKTAHVDIWGLTSWKIQLKVTLNICFEKWYALGKFYFLVQFSNLAIFTFRLKIQSFVCVAGLYL